MKKARGLAWNPETSPAENTRRVLPELFRRFLAEGDEAALPETPEDRVHAFRLQAKRFRYTLESFTPVYGAAMKKRIEEVRQVQRVLGQFNDCRTALDLIQRVEPNPDAETRAWIEAIERRLAEKRLKFSETWDSGFARPVKQRQFIRYLTQFAVER
jgi:CHAD domain-containing protein